MPLGLARARGLKASMLVLRGLSCFRGMASVGGLAAKLGLGIWRSESRRTRILQTCRELMSLGNLGFWMIEGLIGW